MTTNRLSLLIVLESPPKGVAFGIQEGKGSSYTTVSKVHSVGRDCLFSCSIEVKKKPSGALDFAGPIVQGKPGERFIYLDIGKLAGQEDSPWERRIKVPLSGIPRDLAEQAMKRDQVLQARIEGTAKDGGPACATCQPIDGWTVGKRGSC
jgi:hypothetical protein